MDANLIRYYGWLPYEYILRGLAVDWWTILENEWIDTGNFKLDNRIPFYKKVFLTTLI